MRFFQTIIFLIISFSCLAQIRFEKGYFIDNDDKKVDCLIKNEMAHDSPTSFTYQMEKGGEKLSAGLETIKEWGIPDKKIKFTRTKVKIDFSTDLIDNISQVRTPEWQNHEVYLLTLEEGSANLFYWHGDNKTRFFFSTDSAALQQLVFKRYEIIRKDKAVTQTNLPKSKYAVAENKEYVYQLLKNVNCSNKSQDEMIKVKYAVKDMQEHFKEHNKCKEGS